MRMKLWVCISVRRRMLHLSPLWKSETPRTKIKRVLGMMTRVSSVHLHPPSWTNSLRKTNTTHSSGNPYKTTEINQKAWGLNRTRCERVRVVPHAVCSHWAYIHIYCSCAFKGRVVNIFLPLWSVKQSWVDLCGLSFENELSVHMYRDSAAHNWTKRNKIFRYLWVGNVHHVLRTR